MIFLWEFPFKKHLSENVDVVLKFPYRCKFNNQPNRFSTKPQLLMIIKKNTQTKKITNKENNVKKFCFYVEHKEKVTENLMY